MLSESLRSTASFTKIFGSSYPDDVHILNVVMKQHTELIVVISHIQEIKFLMEDDGKAYLLGDLILDCSLNMRTLIIYA